LFTLEPWNVGLFEWLHSFVPMILLAAWVGGIIGIPLALLLGWPAYRLLNWRGHKHPLVYVLCFSCIAMLSPAVGALYWEGTDPDFLIPALRSAPLLSPFFAPFGAIGGYVFWRIRRPDII
ncbi:MAG: hypothetical protein KDB61_11400, partial [Planctomycetes bacterium]|nr:hypothetical protein [Planctomycetota bacterium]